MTHQIASDLPASRFTGHIMAIGFRRPLRRGFTLIELLVVIAIITILMAILLPTLEHVRHQSYIAKCASKLRQIGMALSTYSNENHGDYPRTRYAPGSPPTAGTGAASPDPFAASGPQPNDVSAAIYLLRRTQNVPAELFICPYNDVTTFEPDTADPLTHSNFTDYRKNLGYSYANPYPSKAVEDGGYRLGRNMRATFAIAADLNPGTKAKGEGDSRNHEDEGQNVLWGDGHVTWEQSPALDVDLAGFANRSIYQNRAGQTAGLPNDKDDSVLLPALQ